MNIPPPPRPVRFLAWVIAFGVGWSVGFCMKRAHAADSGACYTISDADARTYCLARAHREPAKCYSIQGADMRSMCLAEVRR